MPRKRTQKMYFGEEQEQAVIRYLEAESKEEKDKILRNSFVYKIGDYININGRELIIHKRNKKSCFFILNEEIISIKKDECLFIWDKKELED